jgi:hypothetical protein
MRRPHPTDQKVCIWNNLSFAKASTDEDKISSQSQSVCNNLSHLIDHLCKLVRLTVAASVAAEERESKHQKKKARIEP